MKLVIASAASLALVAANPGSHADCGYPGIGKEECEATGQCAWNYGLDGEPVCFYKMAVPHASCKFSCEELGGKWDPEGAKDQGKDWQNHFACYYPNTALLPTVSGGNEHGKHDGTHANCGWAGMTEAECKATGDCAWGPGFNNYEPSCYYKVDCFSYATQEQCASKGCVWDPQSKTDGSGPALWCYYPNSRSLPRKNVPKTCAIDNPDESKRSYSSIWLDHAGHSQSMYDSPQAWTAHQDRQQAGEWMMIDFGAWTFVSGIVIQKRADIPTQYVENVSLSFYSTEEAKNANIADRSVIGEKDIQLVYDPAGEARIDFQDGVYTRYVKITVNAANEYLSMRAAGITCV